VGGEVGRVGEVGRGVGRVGQLRGGQDR